MHEKISIIPLVPKSRKCYNLATRTRALNYATRPVLTPRPSPSPDGRSHRMTTPRFDAPASKTPLRRGGRFRHTERDGIAFRLVRVVWLTAIFARSESVTIADY